MGVVGTGNVRKISGSYYILIDKEIRKILEDKGIKMDNVKFITYEIKEVVTPTGVINIGGDNDGEGSKA